MDRRVKNRSRCRNGQKNRNRNRNRNRNMGIEIERRIGIDDEIILLIESYGLT